MANTIDEILNGSDEVGQVQDEQQIDGAGEGLNNDNQPTGEEVTQVAAEDGSQSDEEQSVTVKSELAALAKERERIRQKEAALDAEIARMQEQQTGHDDAQAVDQNQQQPGLKELRRQYREALSAALIDPSDDEAAQLVEELEDKLESARISMVTQAQKSVSVQEKAEADFKDEYEAVHADYPFLNPDHPQVDALLNADINAFYDGLLKRGESKAVALRKAVDAFAPAQAKKLGLVTTKQTTVRTPSQTPGSVSREKLKGGFSEVPNTGNTSRTNKPFTGPTPMEDILGRSST